jgi:hypothetical protein
MEWVIISAQCSSGALSSGSIIESIQPRHPTQTQQILPCDEVARLRAVSSCIRTWTFGTGAYPDAAQQRGKLRPHLHTASVTREFEGVVRVGGGIGA